MLGWKAFGAGISLPLAQAICQDVATSVSAAGTTQGTATELGATDSEIGTVGAGAGVVLSAKLAPGDSQTVFNAGANAVKIYPPTGMKINALAANAPMTLGTNTGCFFQCVSTTRVFAIMSA